MATNALSLEPRHVIVKPRIRGFICTTAHPKGCAANVREQIAWVRDQPAISGADAPPKNVLVIGASGGYGLASRIVSAFGAGANTLGISFEKAPDGKRTGTAGWYNTRAFEADAAAAGLGAWSLDGDAFSDDLKQQAVDLIREHMGQVDLVVYSLASPVRQHPKTGELHRSAIKPVGDSFHVKTLNVDSGVVHEVDLEPATQDEIDNTVTVMGGEDWEFWLDALGDAGVLADGCKSLAYTYIGSELTWPIYWEATLGKAKEDLDRAAAAIRDRHAGVDARVAVLKAVVTQASSAIPVVPLYASLLFRVMKDMGNHEDCIDHIHRMFAEQVYGDGAILDDVGRLRVDNIELSEPVQAEVKRRWPAVTTENLPELGDLDGFRADFLRIFGFGVDGVDYDADIPIDRI